MDPKMDTVTNNEVVKVKQEIIFTDHENESCDLPMFNVTVELEEEPREDTVMVDIEVPAVTHIESVDVKVENVSYNNEDNVTEEECRASTSDSIADARGRARPVRTRGRRSRGRGAARASGRARGTRGRGAGRSLQAQPAALPWMTTGFLPGDGDVKGLPQPGLYNPSLWAMANGLMTSPISRPFGLPMPAASDFSMPGPSGMFSQLKSEACGGSGHGFPLPVLNTSQKRQALRDEEMESAINTGSEDESDAEHSGDEDGLCPAVLPRRHRMLFQDVDEDAPSAVPTVAAATPDSPPQIGPADMFHFDWRPFPNPPVAPAERREVFSDINIGPTAPFLTPYDAFVAVWDRDIMEYIVAETNRYAQELMDKMVQDGSLKPNSRIIHWQPTDVDEMYVFFALLLAIGIVVKSDLKEYWLKGDILSTPNFGLYMSVKRFLLMTRCVHFAPNSSQTHSLSRSQAKLYKIDPILNHLNFKFQSLYQLGQNIVIDESLTQWKGWLDMKQTKNKAASDGIKSYEVYEAQTGYLWRYKVYAAREEDGEKELTPGAGAVETIVLELLEGLEHKGHTVWMDSFYSSPALARTLKCLGFDCVGTLRTNRQGVPRELSNLKKHQMAVGQVTGATSGDVDILVWRDQNRMAMLSTYHGDAVHTVSTKPTALLDYNMCMSGLDKKDQMLSAYPMERKRTRVWYKTCFRRLLNVSVLNAFILHKQSTMPDTHVRITNHREFRRNLVNKLLELHKARPIVNVTPKTAAIGLMVASPNVPKFSGEAANHFAEEYGTIQGRNEKIRRSCVLCHKRVPWYCQGCKVALCVVGCFKKHHT